MSLNRLSYVLAFLICANVFAGEFDVRKYGAAGDGEADDTAAFQKALDECGADGGGIVTVPTGRYLIKTHLSIPDSVTLEGVWRAPARTIMVDDKEFKNNNGSILLAVEGAGDEDGHPFITLGTNSTLKGMTIFYPNQVKKNPPLAYPWTVAVKPGGADNCSIVDVLMINPYKAVDFGSSLSGRHYIRNLYAHALYRGIYVDACFDVGRIENVHLWPFWDTKGPLRDFTRKNGKGIIIGRTDWQTITNCFMIGYNIGYEFVTTQLESLTGQGGGGNCMITGGGPDMCNVAIYAKDTQYHSGIQFSNCQIFGDVIIGPKNYGPIKFSNCGFFGSIHGDNNVTQMVHEGSSRVSFDNCHFVRIFQPLVKPIDNVMHVKNGRVSIMNCEFKDTDERAILLDEGCDGAVIIGNEFVGKANVVSKVVDEKKVIINSNLENVGEFIADKEKASQEAKDEEVKEVETKKE